MRDKQLSVLLILSFAILSLAGCISRPNISGLWKGTIQASGAGGKDKWQGPAELTLNQNGDALTGTLVLHTRRVDVSKSRSPRASSPKMQSRSPVKTSFQWVRSKLHFTRLFQART